jgi:predicted peptidase
MNRHTALFLTASLALTVLLSEPPVAAQSAPAIETGFIDGQVTVSGTTMLYIVYVPWNYTPEEQWSVILCLHGSTIEGKDGFKPLLWGLGPHLWL